MAVAPTSQSDCQVWQLDHQASLPAWAKWPNGLIGGGMLYIPPNQQIVMWRSYETYLGTCCSILELLTHIVLKDHFVISVGAPVPRPEPTLVVARDVGCHPGEGPGGG